MKAFTALPRKAKSRAGACESCSFLFFCKCKCQNFQTWVRSNLKDNKQLRNLVTLAFSGLRVCVLFTGF